jgi:hypothetical protein
MNPKNHWNDFIGWVMAECLHKKMIKHMKEVAGSKYLALSCDEVTTIDNQSWISIHYYVVQDWCHLPILIFSQQVIEGGGLDNLIEIIMGVLKKERGGVFDVNVARNLMPFGLMMLMIFKGCGMVLLTKSKISLPPIWKAFTAWHIAPI